MTIDSIGLSLGVGSSSKRASLTAATSCMLQCVTAVLYGVVLGGWLVLPPTAGAGGAALAVASNGVSPYKVPQGPQSYCAPCDVRACEPISPEACNGTLVKDDCGCCPRCDTSLPSLMQPLNESSVTQTNHTCTEVKCRGSQICVLNIQGIPLCRCPSPFWCRRQDRREVCGRDGRTYRSKCYLKVAECTQNKKIRIAHKGQCPVSKKDKKDNKKAKRKQQREERREQREREAQARRQQRRRNKKGGKRGKGERREQRRPKRAHLQKARGANHNQRQGKRKFRFQHQQS